ncbi:MAG: hypothetical protein HOE83_17185 [Alphaproteobacteria bacterium]|jgi:hypothetical protein|nr:hypothetical protein [Alphaproteobacteria bacterium]
MMDELTAKRLEKENERLRSENRELKTKNHNLDYAAGIALIALDLDPENSPPQWTPEDAGNLLKAALST